MRGQFLNIIRENDRWIYFKEMILDLSSIIGVLAKVVDTLISIAGK